MFIKAPMATPASSAPVERVFSRCAMITTRNRNRMPADNIFLTLFLNEAWEEVREMGGQDAVDGMFSDAEAPAVQKYRPYSQTRTHNFRTHSGK